MILSFKQKFDDGSATNFPLAIWKGLLSYQLSTQTQFEMHRLLAKKQNHQILEGELPEHAKIHTLREDTHNRWGHGSMINFYIAARSRARFEFGPYIPCTGTQKVVIQEKLTPFVSPCFVTEDEKIFTVEIDGRRLCTSEIIRLALNDGFKTTDDFFKYFKDGFDGKIIHWTDFRY